MPKPAEKLLGEKLAGGWSVASKLEKNADETGGMFSVGYIVKNDDGRTGFLKAIDFSIPPGTPDAAAFLQKKTRAFTFEKNILERCRNERLRRVVVALEDGQILDNSTGSPNVQYLIFELAQGNLHHRHDLIRIIDDAFVFRAAHHVATGLWQVHQRGIAHLDIKPSNVLLFGQAGSKIADLGRCSVLGNPNLMPHEDIPFAGDPAHAPIEILYGVIPADWYIRRLSSDLYLLGSLVVHLLSDVQLTAQILSRLSVGHRPHPGFTYDKAEPLVRDVLDRILRDLCSKMPDAYREMALETLHELTDPLPERRGNLSAGNGPGQYFMDRYVSRFNLLASRAEVLATAR